MPIAPKIGLIDLPNERKKHSGSIPLIGGLSIFTGVLIASTMFSAASQLLNLYLISSAMLVAIGVLDDMYDLSVRVRMMFQGLTATIMVFGANLYISDLGNLFALGTVDIGGFGMIFTVLAVIACINAYNMIDGIDGLAGNISLVTMISIAAMNFIAGEMYLLTWAMIIVGAIMPFLYYNISNRDSRRKKIFMGDAGSMFLGLTVIWMLALCTQGNDKTFSSVTALWFIGVPLMDMVAIMSRRIRKGHSPFKADNEHLHHIFQRAGLTQNQALWLITSIAILFSTIGMLFEFSNTPDWLSLIAFLAVYSLFAYLLNHSWKVSKFLRRLVKT